MRLWSIKSGELLFQDKFSNAVLSTVCWRGETSRFLGTRSFYFLSLCLFTRSFLLSEVKRPNFSFVFLFPLLAVELKTRVGLLSEHDEMESVKERFAEDIYGLGAWLGSQEGLFYVQC